MWRGQWSSRRTRSRAPDPKDARRALLSLTRKGRASDARTEGTVDAAARAIAGVPQRALAGLTDLLGRVAHAPEAV